MSPAATRSTAATRSSSTATPSRRAINHWITAVCLVLLALSGLALFHPSLFFLTGLFGGGQMTRIAPSLDRGGDVRELRGPVHPLLAAQPLGPGGQRLDRQRRATCSRGDEEKLPEVGKYNAGQKLYFWLMSISIVVLFTQRHRDLAAVLRRPLHHRAEADRGAGALDRRDRGDLPLDRARLCGDLGARHDQRDDPRQGHRRLGLAAPPPLAARARSARQAKRANRARGTLAPGVRRPADHVARAVREETR